MARGINKVILVGNLGADPETRYTAGGSAVTNIRLATAESWKDRQTGEQQERTEWHRIVMFARLAEIAAEYLRKGSQIYIEGRLQTRKWQGQDGSDRWSTEIVANEMQMLGGRGGGGGGSGGGPPPDSVDDGGWSDDSGGSSRGGGGQSAPRSGGGGGSSGGGGAPSSGGGAPSGGGADFDDDIPF